MGVSQSLPQTRSRYEFQQEASLSQQLAYKDKDYQELAGADPKISKKIQRIKNYVKLGWMPKKEADIMLLFLNGDRKAAFATSDKVNEITKLGLQMAKEKEEWGKEDEQDKDS